MKHEKTNKKIYSSHKQYIPINTKEKIDIIISDIKSLNSLKRKDIKILEILICYDIRSCKIQEYFKTQINDILNHMTIQLREKVISKAKESQPVKSEKKFSKNETNTIHKTIHKNSLKKRKTHESKTKKMKTVSRPSSSVWDTFALYGSRQCRDSKPFRS